jgi:hypothetical protein
MIPSMLMSYLRREANHAASLAASRWHGCRATPVRADGFGHSGMQNLTRRTKRH